jgi:hypothetical protein
MGLQIVYGLGALILLTALIYGTLQYASRTGEPAKRSSAIVTRMTRTDLYSLSWYSSELAK